MKASSRITVRAFFELRITELERTGRWGTASNYAKTERSFRHFCADSDLYLNDITPGLVEDYNRYLKDRGLIRNSISQYNRVLRALYNEAVRRELVTDLLPFRKVYTGIDKTSKRALSEKDISKIAAVEIKGTLLELAKDMFLFSYATCGMTFVDMVYLRKRSIKGDKVVYYRRKTGSGIEVRLEPVAKRIIVFPILGNLTGKDAYKRFTSALTEYNRALKKLSGEAGIVHVSSYVPMHSWATAARNNGANVSTISEALGHRSERTTPEQ